MLVELKPTENVSENESNQGVLAVPSDTYIKNSVILDVLHNNLIENELVPSEVQSTLLCSNNFVSDCTSLGGKTQDEIETKNAKQLAEIIFNLWQKQLKLNTMDLPIQE